MTDKLHCPFCGAELEPARDSFGNILTRRWTCLNQTCIAFGDQATTFLWTKVIDGKKAQEELDRLKRSINNGSGIKN